MYYVLAKNDQFVGIVFTNAYELNLGPEYSISQFIDVPVPDLNATTWNSELGKFVENIDKLTKLGFLNLFTMGERIAIRSSTDPIVVDIMNLLDAAEYVSKSDQSTIQSVGYLGAVGLIAPTRVSEILS